MALPRLVGREAESARLERALADAIEHGSAVLVSGAPGIGKTSLLEHTASSARARGYRVLGVTGVESEAALPYAGLHQLLQRVMDSVGGLPAPQKNALLVALGMRSGAPPEVFLVGLATLNLLEELADTEPLVVVVDDVQWLDVPTSSVLGFMARRLEATHLLLIIGIRESSVSPSRLPEMPEMHLEPLNEEASAELLDAVASDLDHRTRRLILGQALGNPLALLELPRAFRSDRTSGREGAVRSLPLTDRLERAFSAEAARLPRQTQTALLLVALDHDLTASEVLGAAGKQLNGNEIDVDALQPAIDAGLISITGPAIGYRHPVMRSAIEQAATPGQRIAAHEALAAVVTDPDRRAWHRAKSVLGTDEGAASDLDAAAGRAHDRGAPSTAVGALELAASLTPDGTVKARRLLAAAEMAFQLGDPPAVGRLLDAASRLDLSSNDVGRTTWLREIFHDGAPGDPEPITRLVAVASDAAAQGDRNLALNLLQGAALRCWWADPGPGAKALVVDAVESIAGDELDPRALEILSLAAPLDTAARIADRLQRATELESIDSFGTQLLAFAAYAAGEISLSMQLMDRVAPILRAEGRLGLLAQLLAVRAWAGLNTGQFDESGRAAEDANRLAIETEQPIWTAISQIARAVLLGLEGDEPAAEGLIAEACELVSAQRLSLILAKAALARGIIAMTAGRHADAVDHLSRMFLPEGPAFHELVAHAASPLVVECAIRAGRLDVARRLMSRLEMMAERTPAARVHIGLRFGRALLADESQADELYGAALNADPKWPFDYARLEMVYGAWLRRQRRIGESRPHLRAARDGFDALGVTPWADKARAELRASGERSPMTSSAPRPPLSPQELQIAQLAASGLSNREIGDRLFLSHRTVGVHLYRVFPKLGVVSRSKLGPALASTEPALTR